MTLSSSLLTSLILFFLCTLSLVSAGCWQRRLCCPGRNTTCKATDDGIGHLPKDGSFQRPFQRTRDRYRTTTTSQPSPYEYVMPHYEASGEDYRLVYPDVIDEAHHEKIGRLILPDVIELEGSGGNKIYERYEGSGMEEGSGSEPGLLTRTTSTTIPPPTTPARMFKHLIFGMPEGPEYPPPEEIRYQNKPRHLLIRSSRELNAATQEDYSILSQHLPLTVSTTSIPFDEDQPHLMYLEAPEMECYCDEECVKLGDCCSDYTYVCPPQDCLLDHWSSWRECVPDKDSCGMGVQERDRRIRAYAERGGAECDALKEMRTCWKECKKQLNTPDITTVALLLDYKFNKTRSARSRNNVYWDLPDVAKRLKEATYYCVEYELGWVNKNCVNKAITKRLHTGNRICGECQPEAQLHRKNKRCASDLEDGEQGFWKLIGPKSCNGIWTRVNRTDNCRCSEQFPERDPFLLV